MGHTSVALQGLTKNPGYPLCEKIGRQRLALSFFFFFPFVPELLRLFRPIVVFLPRALRGSCMVSNWQSFEAEGGEERQAARFAQFTTRRRLPSYVWKRDGAADSTFTQTDFTTDGQPPLEQPRALVCV